MWPNPQETADLVTLTEEILNGKLPFLCNYDHDKYITTQGFDKLTSEHFSTRLAQADLSGKNDIANFIKKDFDAKLKNIYKNLTSNKTKHVLEENILNEISKNVKARSTKRLAKDLINKFSILNEAKYFSSGIFQYCLVLYQLKNTVNILVTLFRLIRRNLMECQKKLNQTATLHQLLLIIMYYQT